MTWDYLHIDAATIFMATNPSRFDVIVTDNLFGDIITDLAASVTGGIGLAASGNINAAKTAPSMFEPIHGSAPDIAGKGLADPSATVLSVAMMLDFLGHADLAKRVEDAVAADAAAKGGATSRATPGGRRARSATRSRRGSAPVKRRQPKRRGGVGRPVET